MKGKKKEHHRRGASSSPSARVSLASKVLPDYRVFTLEGEKDEEEEKKKGEEKEKEEEGEVKKSSRLGQEG